MSFDFFGDGGGSDEDDVDLDAFDDTGLLALASRERAERSAAAAAAASASSPPAPAFAAAASAAVNNENEEEEGEDAYDESDGGDWDNVDWEDAGQDEDSGDGEEGAEDTSRAFPSQGVTIHFGKGKSNHPDEGQEKGKAGEGNDGEGDTSKKRKRKTTRVLRSVPAGTRQMILNIRRSDMLCSVARCTQQSYICGGGNIDGADEERLVLSSLAYSLAPEEFHQLDTAIPTKETLRQFARWFFQFVNQAGRRRRDALQRNVAQGAAVARMPWKRRQEPNADARLDAQSQSASPKRLVQLLTFLSPRYDEDPQLSLEEEGIDVIEAVEQITAQEKALLFLAMVRSLGWRACYVTSLNPVPLELTVDHPLLALDGKPSPNEKKLQKLLRLMHQNGILERTESTDGARKRKRPTKSANNTKTEAIELLSSDEEGDVNEKAGKKGIVDESLSPSAKASHEAAKDTAVPTHSSTQQLLLWVEVLCYSEDSDRKSMSPAKPLARWAPILPEQESFDAPEDVESILATMEAGGCNGPEATKRRGKMSDNAKSRRRTKGHSKRLPVSYVLAVEHPPLNGSGPAPNGNRQQLQCARFTDVTPRYANTWSRSLRLRGASGKQITAGGGICVDEWWKSTLKQMNKHFLPTKDRKSPPKAKSPVSVTKAKTSSGKVVDVLELGSSDDEKTNGNNDFDSDEHESIEAKELTGNLENEQIPTSKAAFKQSPFYVIPSVLNSQDVLHPDARKRICGVFKGELVYRRSDVSKALREKKWLYRGRKVKENELEKPVKRVKARKKPVAKGFKQLDSYGVTEEAQEELIASMDKKKATGENDEMDSLYGIWQTEKWSPPYVGPTDAIPTNEYKNVELALINPGLTHMDQPRLASIARKLGLPYAPCMLGYETRGTPTIRGIVVHDHNVALLREASLEWEGHAAEKAEEERRREVLKRWKRLVVGILTKERLEREYG